SSRFHGGLLQDGPEAASPMFFAESVLNAPAGNVAMAFGIRGPVHTMIGEETVGAQALEAALALLRAGVVDRCVVVGTEERCPVIDTAYERMDRVASVATPEAAAPPLPGEGAAAIVVEHAGEAIRRGATLRVPVLSVRCCRGVRGGMEDSVARAAGEQLASVAVRNGETAHVVLPTGRNRDAVTRGALRALGRGGDGVLRLDITPSVGNPFGAAALLQVSVSAALLSSGDPSGAGLVLSSGIGKTFSSILLGGSRDGTEALPR
ncbi:MAG TPA: beta-ketoacyl synthase N-terminal-like domain-containing protein, partial [Candidatus Deferrimicrobiaceae bacterium]